MRLLAVCSFLPVSPMRFVSSCSTNIWMSSLLMSMGSAPLSRSSRMDSSPSTSCAFSGRLMMPQAESISAWAMLPVISCLYMRLSKAMEELKSSAI